MFELLAQDRANRAALLVVHERYTNELAPFVKDSKTRLEFVRPQLDAILSSVAEETGADFSWVAERFDAHLADTVEGLPPAKFEEGDPLEGTDVKDSDVQDRGTVDGAGLEEALDPPALEHQDLADSSGTEGEVDSGRPTSAKVVTAGQSDSCVRCGKSLNPVIAKHTPVCPACTSELKKKAGPGFGESYEDTNPQSLDYLDESAPGAPDQQYSCTICGPQVTGSRDEIYQHVQRDHADAVAAKQNEMSGLAPQQQQFQQASKEADVPDADDPNRAEVEPLPETSADRFDDMIQDLADRAAARKFSSPSEQDIQSIASQLGVDAEQVRQALLSTATFGNYTAVNGEIGGDATPPQGYEEVSVQGLGGRVDSHEALVPVDLVVNKVADSLNMEPDLVYQEVADKYGADLPDKYHASVSGESHFFLPTELAGNQQAAQPDQTQQYDPNVGPAAPPAPEPTQTV